MKQDWSNFKNQKNAQNIAWSFWTKNEIPILVRHIQFLTTNWTNFTVNTYASPSSLANISTSAIYWIYVGVVKKFNTFAICNQIGQKCSFSFIGLGVFSNNANYLNLQISVNSRSTILFWICYFPFSNIFKLQCNPDLVTHLVCQKSVIKSRGVTK